MVFGIFIDVPLIVGGFYLMYRFRKRLAQEILRVKMPPLALSLLISVPLIIFEEQIDCMPALCGAVLIPPTLPFLFVEILVLAGLVQWRHAVNVKRITLAYAVFGVLWEIFLGGLIGASPLIIPIFGPYVMIGYGFISLLPVTVLVEGSSRAQSEKGTIVQPITTPVVKVAWSRLEQPTMKTTISYR